jgi:hypothetical protein
MPRYLIERGIPGASQLTEEQLAEIARLSNAAADSLGEPYTWVTSYIAGDKIYDLFDAEDEEAVIEHTRRGGFPVDLVAEVTQEFGPQTADR